MANPLESTRFSTTPSECLSTLTLISAGTMVAVSVAIMMPPVGIVTRLRAQYNPKGLPFDPEREVQPRTDPVITSFFAMLVRVGRIEGPSGLYKGLVPTLLNMLSVILVITTLSLLSPDSDEKNILFDRIGRTLVSSVLSVNLLVFSPLTVIVNRAITTRYKLPYFNVLHSWRIFLTSTERRRPWVLGQIPGLSTVQLLQCTHLFLFTMIRRRFLPRYPQPGQLLKEDFLLRFALFIVFTLPSTLVLAPLQVIFIRLSLQRSYAIPGLDCNSLQEVDVAEAVEYFGPDENVISLRTEGEPYTGLIDCAKKIVDEEGWGALYRAWWWTAFALLVMF